MDLVTITDHNTISGSAEIAHLPGTFISEEITAYFPDDGCKAHVLVYDINDAIHREIQKVRENIFDLVDYLAQTGIVHVLAHPLYSVNDKLTSLLQNAWEPSRRIHSSAPRIGNLSDNSYFSVAVLPLRTRSPDFGHNNPVCVIFPCSLTICSGRQLD
jgi:hypothetical protein